MKSGRGLGLRFVQVLAVMYIIPAIVVLALENKLAGEVGAIVGTVAGFTLGTLKDSDGDSKS